MIVVAVIYLLALSALVGGLAFSPDHHVSGYPAAVGTLTLFASGAVLAVSAL